MDIRNEFKDYLSDSRRLTVEPTESGPIRIQFTDDVLASVTIFYLDPNDFGELAAALFSASPSKRV